MEFAFTDHAVHKQVLRLLLVCAKRQFTKREMASCRALLQELVIEFFKLTPNSSTRRAGGRGAPA